MDKESGAWPRSSVSVVCFAGHRDISDTDVSRLSRLLNNTLEALVERGATTFRVGGAVGFDMLAALKVLDLKARYSHIRLELILPCRNQTERWGEAAVRTYQFILDRADNCRFLFDTYFDGCMLERDRQLVEGSDVCVSFCKQSQGGTAYTFAQALRAGLEIINLGEFLM